MLLSLLPSTLALGCGGGEDDDEVGDDEVADDGAPNEMCLSGVEWVGGEQESPRMHPGNDCLDCHQSRGEAEDVVLAGTVYGAMNEADDCFGVEGVRVQITDSQAHVFELVSNSAGNFVLEFEGEPGQVELVPPYSAKLIYEGRERVMATMQTLTSCNSCHTQTGANGAPGRILAP
ncbi:MAG: hypothetical protein HC927_09985 [Deltaproteobacteria bacterium]|nr:hypothetical protein [Deltaproteobacteria bacterium]